MATGIDQNLQLDSQYTYDTFTSTEQQFLIQPTVGGDVTIITTINGGGGGQATGPAITLGSNWSGVNFVATAGSVNLDILNAANARTDLGAAASGANGDLNTFSALTGSSGWSAWTGGSDKTSHATYPTTVAAVAYDQTQMQGLMDEMKFITDGFAALLGTLLAWGGAKA